VSPSDDRRLVLIAIAPPGLALVAIGHQVIDALAPRFITEPLTKSQAVALAAALAKGRRRPAHVASNRIDLRSRSDRSTHSATVYELVIPLLIAHSALAKPGANLSAASHDPPPSAVAVYCTYRAAADYSLYKPTSAADGQQLLTHLFSHTSPRTSDGGSCVSSSGCAPLPARAMDSRGHGAGQPDRNREVGRMQPISETGD
jgi:hypothetical protein